MNDFIGPENKPSVAYGAYDHRERRSGEQKAADLKAAQEKDEARTRELGGTRIRSEAAGQRRAEREAVQQAASREKARLDSEAAQARADKRGEPPGMTGKGGAKVTGDEIVKQAEVKGIPEGYGPIRRNVCVNGFAGFMFVLGTPPQANGTPAP